jgi:hypothetical protein
VAGELSPEHDETRSELCLVVPGQDGSVYVVPKDALEPFRVSDEEREDLEAKLSPADEVEGFQYIGRFVMDTPTDSSKQGAIIAAFFPGWHMMPWRPRTDYYPRVN